MQCEQVKFRSEKKVKINVCHSVVAVGTVEVCVCVCAGGGRGGAPYLGAANGKWSPSLSFR